MMKTEIHIDPAENNAFRWFVKDGISFIGYFFDERRNFYSDENALKYIHTLKSSDVKTIIEKLDGEFSIISQSPNNTQLYVDKSRSFPLFYTTIDRQCYVSNNPIFLAHKQPSLSFDKVSTLEFLSSAYVFNNRTLFENIYQVYPSEIVTITNKIFTDIQFYFQCNKKSERTDSRKTLSAELTKLLDTSGENTVRSIGSQPVLLPLSGGYDSRLIACLLKKYDAKNVVTFTYGRAGTSEIEISKQVAKKLNFKWYCIDYTSERITGYADEEDFQKYYPYSSKATSMFFLQEYFALRWLKNNHIIDSSFITLPGHGGILAGSMLGKVVSESTSYNNAAKKIAANYSIFQRLKPKDRKRILDSIKTGFRLPAHTTPYRYAEDWILKERHAKYLINSVSTHTFWGLKYRLPLFNNELTDFFANLPYSLRIANNLNHQTLEEEYFTPFGVNFTSTQKASTQQLFKQALKSQIKPYLPFHVKDQFRIKQDWVMYNEATQPFLSELNKKSLTCHDNGYAYQYRILNWYLLKLKEEFDL